MLSNVIFRMSKRSIYLKSTSLPETVPAFVEIPWQKATDERDVIDIDLLVKKKEGWVKVSARQSTEKNA